MDAAEPSIVVQFARGQFLPPDQHAVAAGFARHSSSLSAPEFRKESFHWCARAADGVLVGAASADLLWDWLYLDELWVDESQRGTGLGRRLIAAVEEYARQSQLSGVWLWTQSWQAEGFYKTAGYEEFARFPNFPRGHERIGFRKVFSPSIG